MGMKEGRRAAISMEGLMGNCSLKGWSRGQRCISWSQGKRAWLCYGAIGKQITYAKSGNENIEVIGGVQGAVEVVRHCLVEAVLHDAALGDHAGRAD